MAVDLSKTDYVMVRIITFFDPYEKKKITGLEVKFSHQNSIYIQYIPFCRLYSAIMFNLLTPNINYSGRTAPLTSKVAFYIFIQQI